MTTASRLSPARVFAAAVLAASAAVVVAGCTSDPVAVRAPVASPRSSVSASASESASAQPTAGASASSPPLVATPLSVPCTTLAPSAGLAAAYPGMTSVTGVAAPAHTDAAVIGAYQGTVCTWKNAKGSTMTLAVGQFDNASLTKLENTLVETSNQVPTYNAEGYFQVTGSTGTAEAFSGSYWLVAVSDTFVEPGSAEPLVDAAIAALTARG